MIFNDTSIFYAPWDDRGKGPSTIGPKAAPGCDRGGALRIMAASLTHDPVPALEHYRGPTLAVNTPDADTPNDVHHLVPGVRHETMEGTSHWMQLDKPEAFNQLLDRFLEGVDGS